MMMTAGRRPDSMRAMRAARVGSGACVLKDRASGAKTMEGWPADTRSERKDELPALAESSAKVAVKRSSVFVVVDFMGDLMRANRTTFECEGIRLVGRITRD